MGPRTQPGHQQGPDPRARIRRRLTFGDRTIEHIDFLTLAGCTGQRHGGFNSRFAGGNFDTAWRAFDRINGRCDRYRHGQGSWRGALTRTVQRLRGKAMGPRTQPGHQQGPAPRARIRRRLTFGDRTVEHIDFLTLAGCTGQRDAGINRAPAFCDLIPIGIGHTGDRRFHILHSLDRISTHLKRQRIVFIGPFVQCGLEHQL